MRKNVFFISLLGLMVLLSSCDDSFSMDEEKSFTPVMYQAKAPEVLGEEATTLLIKGVGDLVFDEIEKTDWKIITRYRVEYRGDHPLKLLNDDGNGIVSYEIDSESLFSIPTNYEDVLLTFDKLKVTYTYLGNETVLMPDGGLKLVVDLEESKREDSPIFFQSGNIVFRLCVGSYPVKIHKLPFCVYADDESIKEWIKEHDEDDKE